MKLSRTVAYALQATLQLAEADSSTPIPCSRLAAKGEMPERFLLQVLRSLVTHGILRSTRGVDGGYTLIRSGNEISLLDIIEAIDGPMDSHLPLEDKLDESFRGNLQQALNDVTGITRKHLSSIRISDLVSSPEAIAAASLPATESPAEPTVQEKTA